uniref:Uncharacterized protein n=1 Tax=Nelumbo nucifera TaxID=4432 RepID=A0A822ZY74_NELNU|nr:TPA_asm: hypothetical protein HUJ06_018046 [Nelumbo nucifera]
MLSYEVKKQNKVNLKQTDNPFSPTQICNHALQHTSPIIQRVTSATYITNNIPTKKCYRHSHNLKHFTRKLLYINVLLESATHFNKHMLLNGQ